MHVLTHENTRGYARCSSEKRKTTREISKESEISEKRGNSVKPKANARFDDALLRFAALQKTHFRGARTAESHTHQGNLHFCNKMHIFSCGNPMAGAEIACQRKTSEKQTLSNKYWIFRKITNARIQERRSCGKHDRTKTRFADKLIRFAALRKPPFSIGPNCRKP